MAENNIEIFNKYQTKLKVTSAIMITLLTFLGAFGALTINMTMQLAKDTTEFAAKCQVEKNENVKQVYKKYFDSMNELVNPALSVMTYLALIFILIIIVTVPFTLYYLYKVLRI